MAKALLIKSSTTEKNEITGVWHKLEAIKPYIQGIKTSDIIQGKDTVDAEALNTLISGVPTSWARTKLFWFAFDYLTNQDANIETGGLIEFYKILINEWKGLLALISLYPDRIIFSDPIQLNEHGELWDLTSSFGRMLFEDKHLWCNPENLKSNPDEIPYIQLIYYGQDRQLIGATSPYTVFITAIDYSNLSNTSDVKWFRFGKFDDPLTYLNTDQIQKLYLVLRNMNKNLQNYEESLKNSNNLSFNIKGFRKYLQDWEKDIKRKNKHLLERGAIPKIGMQHSPFKELFLSELKVYQRLDGELTFTKPQGEYLMELPDLQMLLKEDNVVIGWFELGGDQSLKNSSVHYLTVNNPKDQKSPFYFSLPLSFYGIKLFRNKLNPLLNSAKDNYLVGRITEEGTLFVELALKVDGEIQKLNPREYKIQWESNNRKIFLWPNFISRYWRSYYLYSEYPLNLGGIKFIPFYKRIEKDGSQIIIENIEKNKINFVFATSSKEELKKASVKVDYLVKYPVNEVSDESLKYEISRSDHPLAGLEVRSDVQGKNLHAGYLMLKEDGVLKDLTTNSKKDEAIIGIDFGSTNSCVNYTLINNLQPAKPIKFVNRRVPLIGTENQSKLIAENNELLFYQNEDSYNGQIKSWLHEHDERYVRNKRDEEIAGGVPIYEKNILVNDMDRYKITTQAGILHYNMKWLSEESGNRKKTAYLKTIWFQICADLYDQGYWPVELRWSYPGSFSGNDLSIYNIIFNELGMLCPINITDDQGELKPLPIKVATPITESEAVCKYALSKDFSLDNDVLFLGIDIGGSTSDILLVGVETNDNNENRYCLFKQSSIRVAAGVFFDAIVNSERFRKTIVDFHDSGKTDLVIENIKDVLTKKVTAPFYLNNIFDQLQENELSKFYAFIGKEASFIFIIPAYVTGLLLYYSGKIVSKMIEEYNLKIGKIDLLPFGKGGRIFQWMDTYPGEYLCNPYYRNCFSMGIGAKYSSIELNKRNDILVENKSEVSKGLAVDKEIKMDDSIRKTSDIIGEKGYLIKANDGSIVNLNEYDKLQVDYFRNLSSLIRPDVFTNFQEFFDIFVDYIGPNRTGMIKDISKLPNPNIELKSRLKSYLENDPEWVKASKNQSNFDYKYPFFIAEGMCYLEKVLIPEVFKS